MEKDLKIIKKKYGEKFSHMCRELFPTILEEEGKLVNILLDNFHENHFLYDDIVNNNLVAKFKNYVYSILSDDEKNISNMESSPYVLMEKAGYKLYECKTEEEIQRFRKYYREDEKLCTFNGGRLGRCYVFFAVKNDVDKIKRDDFEKLDRQDEYGTSVISIQFTRDSSHTLSIKNRYNHSVNNPDATFSNNLDNIVEGLTDSFADYFGIVQKNVNNGFELPGYVRANDGKFYKYNYEIYNTYYCCDNVIVDNFEVKKYDKSRYLIIDYFIIDMVDKEVRVYNKYVWDAFIDIIRDIDKINVLNINDGKKITFNGDSNKSLDIFVDKCSRIVKLESDNIEEVGNGFLYWNNAVKECNFLNLKTIGNDFLFLNRTLSKLKVLKLEVVGDHFLRYNKCLRELVVPNLKVIGESFLFENEKLGNCDFSNLRKVGNNFLWYNLALTELYLPKLCEVGKNFLASNIILKRLYVPNLRDAKKCFMVCNILLEEVDFSSLQTVDDDVLRCNVKLAELNSLCLESVGRNFLRENVALRERLLSKLTSDDLSISDRCKIYVKEKKL